MLGKETPTGDPDHRGGTGRRVARGRGAHALLVAAVLTLVGCTPPVASVPSASYPYTPYPSPTLTPRDFTVMTAQPLTTTDPAVAVNDTDTLVATSVYQRLMRVLPDTGELKPDAATDCLFVSRLVYQCELQSDLRFHNGDKMTSSDVRFSILRALRLNTPGTAISMFDALEQVSTPDDQTVRFRLRFADGQFGYALASVVASIVNSREYDADAPLPLDQDPVGSGPLAASSATEDGVTLRASEYYVGGAWAGIGLMRLTRAEDSASAEAALATGEADVVWRTLDEPALARLAATEQASPAAPAPRRWPLPGQRVTRLVWNSESPRRDDATLRSAVALALQQDRTLDSLVPVGIAGHVAAFPVGGRPELPSIEGERVILTLGYDPSAPGAADLARTLRDRIETVNGLSVRVTAEPDADLMLTDQSPWVVTAAGWLQDYVEHPLKDSAGVVEALEFQARTSSPDDWRAVTLLQQQAVADLTVLPVSQSDGILVLGAGLTLASNSVGSGGVLGLWGIHYA